MPKKNTQFYHYHSCDCHNKEIDKPLAKIKFKKRSTALTGTPNGQDWLKRAAARAMLRAVGWQDADFEKPLVAVSTPYTNITPCNAHVKKLGEIIFSELERLGAKPYIFGTPVVTDGQSMGMEGMKYSLPSRDLIADCIEMMIEAYSADAAITISGCDKTVPASLMPLARTNIIGLTLYGGTILPGKYNHKEIDIVSIFEAIGKRSAGKISADEFRKIECGACPTPGACGGMYTANTMATAIEALGMSLPASSSNPAAYYSKRISEEKYWDCINTARALLNLFKQDIHVKDILSKKSFENAITVVIALSGSTNGVLHLLALAREAKVNLTLADFDRINDRTPILADLKPSGKYLMYDLFRIGGLPVVMKELLKHKLLDGDCLTVTGETLGQNLKNAADVPENQDVIYRVDKPFKKKGNHIIILKGNLAKDGAVFKKSGKYLVNRSHSGRARVFDGEEKAAEAILSGRVRKDEVVVIRYEGPKGGPGMREMLLPTSALVGRGLAEHVPLITDGRFSGGSHGMIVGHITPEAVDGGVIAVIQDGDIITIDPNKKSLTVQLSDKEIAQRFKKWRRIKSTYPQGMLAKYAQTVSSAIDGAITTKMSSI